MLDKSMFLCNHSYYNHNVHLHWLIVDERESTASLVSADISFIHTAINPVLRGHLWDKEKVTSKKRFVSNKKFSMTGQENVGLLIQVAA